METATSLQRRPNAVSLTATAAPPPPPPVDNNPKYASSAITTTSRTLVVASSVVVTSKTSSSTSSSAAVAATPTNMLSSTTTTKSTTISMMLLLPDDLISNEIFGFLGKGHFYFVALVNKKFYDLYKRYLLKEHDSSSRNSRHGIDTTSRITTFKSISESVPKCQLFFQESYLNQRRRRRGGGGKGFLHYLPTSSSKNNNNGGYYSHCMITSTARNNKNFRGCSMMWNYDQCCCELLKISAGGSSGNTDVFQYLLKKLIGRSKIQKLLKNLKWHYLKSNSSNSHHTTGTTNTTTTASDTSNGSSSESSTSNSIRRKGVIMKSHLKYYHHIINKDVFESAVRNGNLEILKIARQTTGIPFNNLYTSKMMAPLFQPCYPCNVAVIHQQLPILQWLHDINGCNIDEWTFQLATKAGNIEILEYLFTSQKNWTKVKWNEIYNKVLEGAAYYGHLAIFEWLKQKQSKYQWNLDATTKAIEVATHQNQSEALQWLLNIQQQR